MKKIDIKLLLLFIVLILIRVNESISQQSNVGFKAGFNFATVGGDSGTKTGVHFGIFVENEISKKFKIQPEFIYSQQGGKTFSGKSSLNYNYINFPIIFKVFVDKGFHFQFGPQVGILVSAKFKSDRVNFNVKDQVNDIDFGLALGFGYETKENLTFDFRYNLGLTTTGKDSGDDNFPNKVIQISLGAKF